MGAIRDKINLTLAFESDEILKTYAGDPIGFLKHFCGRKYPQKLKRCFEDIYFGRSPSPAVVANRGGGKTTMFADLGACLYLFRGFDALIIGGSEAQAKNCYNFAAEDLQIDERLDDFNYELGKTLATSKNGNWIKFATASTKSVRGPHCGDPHHQTGMKAHGGITIIDEECETDDDVVRAAKYTTNTAKPGVLLRGSTLHKITGSFARLVEDPGAQGVRLYAWDCFDTTDGCDMECAGCYAEFAGRKTQDWEGWKKKHPEFKHDRGYCEGRAKTGGGWRRLWGSEKGTIESSFLGKETLEEFEIEELGWRPSAEGLVLDPSLLDECLSADVQFMPGMPGLLVIDWGFKGWTCLHAIQQQKDGNVAVLQTQYFHQERDEAIYLRLKILSDTLGFYEVCPDASHPFQNQELIFMGFGVHEVDFAKWKDMGVGWIKGLVERGRLKIKGRKEGAQYYFADPNAKRLFEQLKGWRRGKDGRIVKRDDHGPDALLCGAIMWGKGGAWKAEFGSSGARELVGAMRNY